MPLHSLNSEHLSRHTGDMYHQHAARDSTSRDDEKHGSEEKEDEMVNVPLHQQQQHYEVCIHDSLYLVTLALPPSRQHLSLALHCPRTARTHANTFTADYIQALTRKAQHPLSFAAFVALLSAALASARPTSTAAPASLSSAVLDVLTASDVQLLRSRRQHSYSTSSSSSPAIGDSDTSGDGKRYLVLTTTVPPARLVHLPLPLPTATATASQQPRQQHQLSASTAASSGLSVLTDTIAQLSRALKEARREARQERDSRRQREEVDKGERDSMRAEIAWLKDKVSEHEQRDRSSAGRQQQQPAREWERAASTESLRARLQREERHRRETEVLLAMWRTRCERAEADLARLRLSRRDGHTASSTSSSSSRARARSRDRQSQPPLHRGVGSRSVSPSYMRPTSSTAAKQQHSPLSVSLQSSPRHSHSLSSMSSSRAASPTARTTKQHRSPTPPPLALHPPPRTATISTTRSQRSNPPSPASTQQLRRASSSASTTSRPSSPRSLSPSAILRSTSPLLPRHARPAPHPRHARHSPHSHSLSDKAVERAGSGRERSANIDRDKEEQGSEQNEQKGSSGQSDSLPAAVSDVIVRPLDVHSRLSALQRFLREEKSKAQQRNL